jgi:hypothetical protein
MFATGTSVNCCTALAMCAPLAMQTSTNGA